MDFTMELLIILSLPVTWYLSKNTFPRLSNACGFLSLGVLVVLTYSAYLP